MKWAVLVTEESVEIHVPALLMVRDSTRFGQWLVNLGLTLLETTTSTLFRVEAKYFDSKAAFTPNTTTSSFVVWREVVVAPKLTFCCWVFTPKKTATLRRSKPARISTFDHGSDPSVLTTTVAAFYTMESLQLQARCQCWFWMPLAPRTMTFTVSCSNGRFQHSFRLSDAQFEEIRIMMITISSSFTLY